MSNLRDAFSISMLGVVFGQGFRYSLSFIVAWGLGPEAVGMFAFGLVLLKSGSMISRMGLDAALQKFIPEYQLREDHPTVIGLIGFCFVISILGGLVYIGVLSMVTSVSSYASRQFGGVWPFILAIPLYSMVWIGVSALKGYQNATYTVLIRDFMHGGGAFVLIAVAVLTFQSVDAVMYGYTASLVITALVAIRYIAELAPVRQIRNMTYNTKEIFRYSIPMTLVFTSQYLLEWTDVLMLGFLQSDAEVGLYEISYKTAMVLGLLLVAVNTVFPAVASEMYNSSDMSRLRQVYHSTTKWVVHLTLFGAAFLFLHGLDILRVVGQEFVSARYVLYVIIMGQAMISAIGPASWILSMTDNEHLEAMNTVGVLLLNVGLNFILIRQYGILGAAIATSTSLVLLNTLRAVEVYHLFGMHPLTWEYWKSAVAIVPAVLVMYGVGTLEEELLLAQLLISGVLSATAFLGVLFVFEPSDRDKVLLKELS